MSVSGWWIIGGASLAVVATTAVGLRTHRSFVDLWVVIVIVTWMSFTLDELWPPFGAVLVFVR